MAKIYNRKTKQTIDVKENKLLKILYKTIIGRLLLKILINKNISKITSIFFNSKISKLTIKPFIKKNKINMDEYESKNYKSFNDFFRRDIIENKRPIDKNKNTLISVCDSKLTVYKIDKENTFKIKNSIYSIEELLKNKDLANEYNNGYILIFRLDVTDYHHYIYFDEGKVLNKKHINGKLHTVNPISFEKYKVFNENDREYEILETKNFGKVVQMEVGALNIGKIVNMNQETFSKGTEKGHFEFGASTIILLIKPIIQIDNDILSNSKNNIETQVYLGEKIGKKKTLK